MLLVILALAGLAVASYTLHLHYSHAVEFCDINSHWDCGTVNHSRYSLFHGIPVAVIGMIGYVVLAVLALLRQKALTLIAALAGLGFALYLTNIEAHVLETWCLYCVTSQCIIAVITLLSIVWLFLGRRPKTA
ncbi:vitamin K epoxide reductase family protein [Paracidobacterium acidisoli]|uniref:vitamin K epoxide reductase family protein n=1 Tax=Paracidobacterium acidisoli TaxID=2303751 RepID=UPI001314DB47|nr:vitamin K epoxide reductase family protein [Paracidobacterium acidisoli]